MSRSNTDKNLSHELGGILGSLKAIESLMFPPGDQKNEGIHKTYQNILKKLDRVLGEVDSSATNNPSKEIGKL